MPLEDDAPQTDLSDFAAALGSLRPSPVANRDRIVALAGQASQAGPLSGARRRFWPALAAGLAAVALGEGVLLARRPAPEVVERIEVVRESSASPLTASEPSRVLPDEPVPATPAPVDRAELPPRRRLIDQIARSGLGGLPAEEPATGSAPRLPLLSGRDLFRQELRVALFAGDRS